MSSLMHTIYDVVDASVNHSSYHSERKTLRVKLTVTPEPSARRRDHISTGPDRESSRLHQEEGRSADRRLSSHIRPAHPGQSSEPPSPEGQHYCVDENTERRNHYLDLAGIENYTSRFEGATPPPPPPGDPCADLPVPEPFPGARGPRCPFLPAPLAGHL
ncbi:hypothetical protein J4Q44_G00027380 [Coregonus suidteri]|uniref:Protein naked cuticle homolog n=1 Tax=Coregonus suidteri TaxID=861788 RepID=A0AAN8R7L3_9TELE